MQGSADVNAGLRAIGTAASSLKATLVGIAASVGGLVSLGAAIQQSVKFNAELEQQGVAFKTLLGNAEAASRRMAELARFAAETPFELPEIVQASKVLQSLTNGALASGEGLRLVGDAAAATGRPLEEAAMWIGRLYAGLQSGTPVGEATLRLLEMGLISGTTARRLNDLAESGQGAGEAMTILRDTFGRLGGAMADQSQTFSGLLSTLKDTFNMALADIGKPLFDGLKQGLEELIPVVEGLGEKISAWVSIAIQSFRDGRLSEFIGLNIEAGFEIGVGAAVKVMEKLFDWLGSPEMWRVIGNGLLTAINEAMKLAGAAMVDFLLVPLGSIASYIGSAFSYAFEGAVNFFAGLLEDVINGASEMLGSLIGKQLGTVSLRSERVFAEPDFMRSFGENQEGGQVLKEVLTKFFDESTAAGRELMGVGAGLSIGTSALDSLTKLIAQTIAASKAAKSAGAGAGGKTTEEEITLINVKLELQKLELAYNRQLQQINQARGAVESSWLMTNLEKYQEKKRLLQGEIDLIGRQITALEKLKATATEAEQVQIEQRVVGLQGTAGGVRNQMTGMGPDPQSMGENFQATLINLQNQFGTVAQQMAATFADVFNAATASISTGIQGLIMGTMTWGQALQNIGLSIVNSIVKSFADMVAGWIMSHVIMKGVSTAWSGFQTMLRGKDVAEANATELAKTPALAANATLASIGSFGVAAVIGIAAIAGILAMVGGFKQGGYTGDGNPNDVAGIVHRGEFVVPANAVDKIGLPALQSITSKGMVAETQGLDLAQSLSAFQLGGYTGDENTNDLANVDRIGLSSLNVLTMVGGFKQGGYTGDGNPNDMAGIVHRGEYVVPADAVDRIGLSSLNAMASGGVSDAGAFTSPAAPGPITLNMGVFDNPARLNDWAKSNEGRTVLVDIMRQHAHEFSRA
jgi:hypothetical protein